MNTYRRAALMGLFWLGATATGFAAPSPSQGSGPGYEALQSLQSQAQAALKAGDLKSATGLAQRLLRENTDKTSWNYGNVVYDGNQILGLAALKEGRTAAAERCLIAAGKTPGSPQLDSFGPEMTLAQALQKQGRTQSVLTFLDEIARFWATPQSSTPAQFLPLYQQHAATIQKWKAEIRSGKEASLNRFDFPTPSAQATLPLLAKGVAAPDFTVADASGKPVKLSDFRGKTVVLDFWATWCGPCQQSLPHTNSVAEQFKDKGVVFLGVNVWDKQDAFDKWLPAHTAYDAITFVIDPSPTGKDVATTLYGVSGIPTQYVIDPRGNVAQSFVGFDGPNDDLANAIKAASAS